MSLPLKRALLLFIGGLAGAFAIIPHLGSHLVEFFVDAVCIGVAVCVGTFLAPRTRLESPLIDAALTRRPFVRRFVAVAAQGLAAGLVTSVLLIVLETTLFAPRLPAPASTPPWWTGALYALAGGVSEEVVFHYGLLSALVWLTQRLVPGATAYLVAITVSALALGLSHLFGTAALLPLSPVASGRTLVLSAAGGVVTGWLYWRRSLESSMFAHGVMSFALHVTAPGAFG